MRTLVAALLVAALITLWGCARKSPRTPEPGAHPTDCSAEAPPGESPKAGQQLRLVATRAVAQPGEAIAITIDGGPSVKITRGVDAYIECWTGTEWAAKYISLLSPSGGTNAIVRPYPLPPDSAIVSIGFPGPGPEAMKLPDDMQPGWYRIRKTVSVDGPQRDLRTLYAPLQVVRP